MHRYHRPLLPQLEGHTRQQNVGTEPLDTKRKRRRKNVRIACNACRLKKSGCDGNRPVCSQCIERGTTCEYITNNLDDTPNQALKRKIEDLQQEVKDQSEILNDLKYMPEKEAFEMLQNLRLACRSSPKQRPTRSNTRKRSQTSDATTEDDSPLDSLDLEMDFLTHHRTALAGSMPFDDSFAAIDPMLRSPMDAFRFSNDGIPSFSTSSSHQIPSFLDSQDGPVYNGYQYSGSWPPHIPYPISEETDLSPTFAGPI